MLFNSIAFAIFLPACFTLYWWLQGRSLRAQNLLLLGASYFFYGWWDWRFLSLLFASSTVDYLVGRRLATAESATTRRRLLVISIFTNLGILGFFKYFSFFAESATALADQLGVALDPFTLAVVLPVGISFYTFQTLSYTIDVHARRIEPAADWIAFFAYVSFFPQLVAGPIERARHLLPQFMSARRFDLEKAKDGLRQILWGLFKKVVVADNLAPMADVVYRDYAGLESSSLVLGTVYFAFQIYCDFSGYSDIAIGTARLFGFDLMTNFRYPYFSRDIAEFWRRWHISLSTWFRDYVYIPLGGSRVHGTGRQLLNVAITFVVSGFWHGANWTFLAWGFLHALFYVPLLLARRNRYHTDTVSAGRLLPSIKELAQIAFTFTLVLIGWVFFRSESIAKAFAFLFAIARPPWFGFRFKRGLAYIAPMLVVEWLQREKSHGLDIATMRPALRWTAYYGLLLAIFLFAQLDQRSFIYFQF